MPFTFVNTGFAGLFKIEPRVFGDERGFFLETFKAGDFASAGVPSVFIQDNHSMSNRGTLRGMHLQINPFEQGKLVSVMKGRVWDVSVDLRRNSSTYLRWYAEELSGDNKLMLYIPPGFAHGFISLEDETHFIYKCTKEYSPEHERGIRYYDQTIAIDWPINNAEIHTSPRDAKLPSYRDLAEEIGDIL